MMIQTKRGMWLKNLLLIEDVLTDSLEPVGDATEEVVSEDSVVR